jgi:HAD superfamily hydrolase (TIGR01509 family)
MAGKSPTRAPHPVRRPHAVIFDMDGLMLDTERLAPKAWLEAAQTLAVPFDLALAQPMVGRNFRDCAAIIRDHYGDAYPTEALMRAWHVAYDAIVAREGIRVMPGLADLLDWLDAVEVRKAVATSTRRDRAQAKLAQVGIADRFAHLVGGDEVARGKPAPDIFLAAAQRLRVPAAQCIVLEDSEPGVRAALAAGMTPIMVPDQHPPSAELSAIAPLLLRSLAEVQVHLSTLPP